MANDWYKSLATLEMNPSTKPAPIFTLFSSLPTELRLKIYGIALHTPRTITITCDRPPFKRGRIRTSQSFRSNQPTPALLHVSQESRHEALEVYKPYFKTSRINNTYVSARNSIYVSFLQDTLKFEDSMLQFLSETEVRGIQRLVLDVKDAAYFGHFNMSTVTRMRALRSLHLWASKPADPYSHMVHGRSMFVSSFGDPVNGGNRFLRQLLGAFEDAKEMDPGWECPTVLIFDRSNGAVIGNIEGGALIPGCEYSASSF